MKKLILASALVISFSASAAVSIISDMDDTIKITNAADFPTAAYNGVFTERVFTGMPEFLSEARKYTEELHVVTAAPPFIGGRIRDTLVDQGIRFESVILKKVLTTESKIKFKVDAIKGLMEELGHDVILIGDDVDHDPEVFEAVKKLYPTQVLSSYIHVVEGRVLPGSSVKYWTTFDLALHEHLAGRMEIKSVEKVLDAINSKRKLKYVFPKFAQCPSEATVFEWQLETVFQPAAIELTNKLNDYCRLRRPKG